MCVKHKAIPSSVVEMAGTYTGCNHFGSPCTCPQDNHSEEVNEEMNSIILVCWSCLKFDFPPLGAILQISSTKLVVPIFPHIWPWLWMTLNYMLLVRSHRDLSISNITLWLYSVWFDGIFRQIWSHARRDPWPMSKIRPEKNFILVLSFRITC